MAQSDVLINRLLSIWDFITWLDTPLNIPSNTQGPGKFKQMKEEMEGILKEYDKDIDLLPTDLILGHWLTYIFDLVMKADYVWKKPYQIMTYIAYEYRKGSNVSSLLANHIVYKALKDKKTGAIVNYPIYYIGPQINPKKIQRKEKLRSFSHWLDNKHGLIQSLKSTLDNLCNNRDIIYFILNETESAPSDKFLYEAAIKLNKITYPNTQLDHQILVHKRTWAAFRDYVKGDLNEVFWEGAKNSSFENRHRWYKPNKQHLGQLEIPGDVHNNYFFEQIFPLLKKLLEGKKYPDQQPIHYGINFPRVKFFPGIEAIRVIYDDLPMNIKKEIYPEQFDATFAFRFCEKEMCESCPLGSGRIDNFCIGKLVPQNNNLFYCPLKIHTIGSLSYCDPSKCTLLNNPQKYRGMCPQGREID